MKSRPKKKLIGFRDKSSDSNKIKYSDHPNTGIQMIKMRLVGEWLSIQMCIGIAEQKWTFYFKKCSFSNGHPNYVTYKNI